MIASFNRKAAKIVICAGIVAVALVATAHAQEQIAPDNLTCYKIKDPSRIQGIVDISDRLAGLQEGCKLSKGIQYCTPANKFVRSAVNGKTPIVPGEVYGQPLYTDYLCYKLVCPPAAPFIPSQQALDLFGERLLTDFRDTTLCVPVDYLDGPQ